VVFQGKVKTAFGSTHVKISVFPGVGPVFRPCYSRLAMRPWRTPQPLQTKSIELNWVKLRTSHEPNWLSWVQLMWSTAFDPGLCDVSIPVWWRRRGFVRRKLSQRPCSHKYSLRYLAFCMNFNSVSLVSSPIVVIKYLSFKAWLTWTQ